MLASLQHDPPHSLGHFSFSYNELLFIIDTCQGASMYERFYSPNIMALASSQVGEDSLSVRILPWFSNHVIGFMDMRASLRR